MKKITILTALILAMSLSGCGKDKAEETVKTEDILQEQEEVVVSPNPELEPTASPVPTEEVSYTPTKKPTKAPTKEPTKEPTKAPTAAPTVNPTPAVTPVPTPEATPVPTPEADTRSLEELITKVTSNLGEMPVTGNMPLDSENFEFYTFASYIDGAEGIASEPMMSSIAHSVVLVRLPQGEDAQAFANKMKANADPRKWLCVEAEKVSVASKGNLAILVMSDASRVDKIISNFKNL